MKDSGCRSGETPFIYSLKLNNAFRCPFFVILTPTVPTIIMMLNEVT